MPQYLQSLKETIVEGYTGLTICVKEAGAEAIFEPYISDIFGYLIALCGAAVSYKADFQKSIAGLINDLSRTFGKSVQTYVDNPYIQQLIKVVSENKDPKMAQYLSGAVANNVPK